MDEQRRSLLTADYIAKHRLPDKPTAELWANITGSIHNALVGFENALADRAFPALLSTWIIVPYPKYCCIIIGRVADQIRAPLQMKIPKAHWCPHIPCIEPITGKGPEYLTREYIARHRFPDRPTEELWDSAAGWIDHVLEEVGSALGDQEVEAVTFEMAFRPSAAECCIEFCFVPDSLCAHLVPTKMPTHSAIHIPCFGPELGA